MITPPASKQLIKTLGYLKFLNFLLIILLFTACKPKFPTTSNKTVKVELKNFISNCKRGTETTLYQEDVRYKVTLEVRLSTGRV